MTLDLVTRILKHKKKNDKINEKKNAIQSMKLDVCSLLLWYSNEKKKKATLGV
jgi:hypothetical protein